MSAGRLYASLRRGLVAGMAGTAAITVSMTVEQRLRRKPEPTVAAEAVEKVTGLEPDDEQAELRLSRLVHWLYGTAWGLLRGVLGTLGVRDPLAAGIHFGAVSLVGSVMPPALGVAPKPTEMPAAEVVTTTLHHVVYAIATTAAYRALERF